MLQRYTHSVLSCMQHMEGTGSTGLRQHLLHAWALLHAWELLHAWAYPRPRRPHHWNKAQRGKPYHTLKTRYQIENNHNNANVLSTQKKRPK